MSNNASESSNNESQERILMTALWQARCNNLILLAMLIISVSGFVYINFLWTPSASLNQSKLMNAAAKEITKHAPTLLAEGTEIVVTNAPPVANAFGKQVKADIPIYLHTLKDQGKDLLADMKVSLRKKLQKQFHEYLIEHREVLREELPDIASDEAIAKLEGEFKQAADRLIERYYINQFVKESKRTVKLWHQFKPVPIPKEDHKLEDLLVKNLADWGILRLKDVSEKAAKKGLGFGD